MRRALVVLGLMAVAATASATTVSFSPVDVDNFAYFAAGSSGPAPSFVGGTGDGGYSVIWPSTANGAVTIDLRWLGGPLGLAGDDFHFLVTNQNETPWTYKVAINGGALSAPFSLVPDASFLVQYNFLSAPVSQVDLYIVDSIPHIRANGTRDRNAELEISAVPEPGTLLLLGSGISALVLRRRRKA